MTRFASLAYSLLCAGLCVGLTACAAANNPRVTCDRAAYDDPAVKQATIAQLGNISIYGQQEIDRAHHAAALKCLRARGLAAPGGVEAPGARVDKATTPGW